MATNSLKKKVQHEAYTLVTRQLSIVFILSAIGLLFHNWHTSLGILSGGLAYGLANLIFVWRVFRYVGATQMAQFMAAFMAFEIVKLFLSGLLVLIVVKTLPVSLLSVLAGFIGAIAAFWIVCIHYFTKQQTVGSPRDVTANGAAR